MAAAPDSHSVAACTGQQMDDPNDLILAMLALAITAVMLVAGALYLITRPEPTQPHLAPPAAIVTSSAR
jgi:hypothetical protein